MSEPFRGTALPLDQEGLAEVIDRLVVGSTQYRDPRVRVSARPAPSYSV